MTDTQNKPRKTTLMDVARHAGVSRTTASCILRHQGGSFAAGTQKRVMDAAHSLGFRPNAFARWLRTGQPKLLGLLTPVDLESAAHVVKHRIEVGIALEARKHGMDIIKVLLSPDLDSETARVSDMLDSGLLDCVILENPPADSPVLSLIASRHGSFVVIGRPADEEVYSVDSDNFELGRACARHLIELGHQNIAYIGPLEKWAWGNDRAAGFADQARDAGLAKNRVDVVRTDHGTAGGDLAMRGLLDSNNPPTGVAAADDETAYGAVWAVQDLGMSVPDDVSVMGCNNDFSLGGSPGFLTSFEIESVELGAMAARKAIALTAGQAVERRSLAEFRLIKRRSTCAPRLRDL